MPSDTLIHDYIAGAVGGMYKNLSIFITYVPYSVIRRRGVPFQNNPPVRIQLTKADSKNPDPSCKTDLDFSDCLRRKTPFYSSMTLDCLAYFC